MLRWPLSLLMLAAMPAAALAAAAPTALGPWGQARVDGTFAAVDALQALQHVVGRGVRQGDDEEELE